MSLSPVTPDQFKASLPDPNSSLCGNLVASLIRFPQLVYEFFSWGFTSTGAGSKSLINQSLPPGSLVMSACLQNEDGTRLLADGREVSQATYPDLFAALGATYGTASDPTHNFKLPNFSARFPVGIGSFASAGSVTIGVAGGEDQHTNTLGEIAKHNHTLHGKLVQHGTADTATFSPNTEDGRPDGVTLDTGSDTPTPFDLIPPYLGVYVYLVC